jgi:hypothetical protein
MRASFVVVSSTPTPLALLTNPENKFSVTFRRALGGAYRVVESVEPYWITELLVNYLLIKKFRRFNHF